MPTNAPIRVTVNISTKPGDGPSWGLTSVEHVTATFGTNATVDAGRMVFDELWDGPVAPPVDPRDWNAMRHADAMPLLQAALGGLRDALVGADLAHVPAANATPGNFATIHATYAQRPVGLDHLHPFRERDGSWTVPLRTSLDDLFVEPHLAPVVAAAQSVLAAAR